MRTSPILMINGFLLGAMFLGLLLPVDREQISATLINVYRVGISLETFALISFFLSTTCLLFLYFVKRWGKAKDVGSKHKWARALVRALRDELPNAAAFFCYLGILLLVATVVCVIQVVLQAHDNLSIVLTAALSFSASITIPVLIGIGMIVVLSNIKD